MVFALIVVGATVVVVEVLECEVVGEWVVVDVTLELVLAVVVGEGVVVDAFEAVV